MSCDYRRRQMLSETNNSTYNKLKAKAVAQNKEKQFTLQERDVITKRAEIALEYYFDRKGSPRPVHGATSLPRITSCAAYAGLLDKVGWEPTEKNPKELRSLNYKNLPPHAQSVIKALNRANGIPLVVGGPIRDCYLGKDFSDIDIECYGLSQQQIIDAVKPHAKRVDTTGKQFGVIKAWFEEGQDVDIAIPRRENKVGVGHKDFDVSFNAKHPSSPLPDGQRYDDRITPLEAAARRDFTINSMAYDPVRRILLDPYDGRRDAKNKLLRHTSSAFAEDPLRVDRGVQFAARMGLEMAPETTDLCRSIPDKEFYALSSDRVKKEWGKLWSQGIQPSQGLKILRETGRIRHYPSLNALVGCPQDPEWHPEGDVFQHTSHVLDAAHQIAMRDNLTGFDKEVLMTAALAHDIAKPETTFVRDDGRIVSPAHDAKGVAHIKPLLQQMGYGKQSQKYAKFIEPLIKHHMYHIGNEPTPANVRKLANKLKPATIEQWERLVEADHSGRPPLPPSRPAMKWLELAMQENCHNQPVPAIVTGKMLYEDMKMPELPKKRRAEMGEILRSAYKAQLDGKLNEQNAREWVKSRVPQVRVVQGRDLIEAQIGLQGREIGEMVNRLVDKQSYTSNKERLLNYAKAFVIPSENITRQPVSANYPKDITPSAICPCCDRKYFDESATVNYHPDLLCTACNNEAGMAKEMAEVIKDRGINL